jgi:transposase
MQPAKRPRAAEAAFRVTLADKMEKLDLPAYSPEFNPVEKLWDIMKDEICNKDWANLDQLEEKITERIKPY